MDFTRVQGDFQMDKMGKLFQAVGIVCANICS